MPPAEFARTFQEATRVRITLICWACFFGGLTLLSLLVDQFKYTYVAQRQTQSLIAFLVSAIEPIHIAVVLLVAVSIVMMLVMEYQHNAVTLVVSSRRNAAVLILLIMPSVWFAHALLASGIPVTGDANAHIARVSHLYLAIKDNSSLYWDNYIFAGGTLLQFTGPVLHWAATLIALAIGDPANGTKLLVASLRIFSALATFAFLRQLGIGQFGALFGALAYVGSFAVTYLLSYRSTFPQILNLTLLPILFLSADKVLTEVRAFGWSWWLLCISAVLMIGNHQPTALLAAVYCGIFVVIRMTVLRVKPRALVRFVAASAVILVCSAFFWVPFIAETGWTADQPSAQLLTMLVPSPTQLWNYVSWTRSRGGVGADYSAYLGIVAIASAVCGIASLTFGGPVDVRKLSVWMATVILTILSLFLSGPYVRPVVFILFFVAIAAAVGTDVIVSKRRPHMPAILLAALLVDVGIAAVQPWNRTDLRQLADLGRELAGKLDNQRIIEVGVTDASLNTDAGPGASPLQYARLQVLSGPHKMDATKAHNALVATVKIVQEEFRGTGRLSASTLAALQMMNVGWIVGHQGARLGLPLHIDANSKNMHFGRHVRISDATPVLASGRLRMLQPPAGFDDRPLWNDDFDPEGKAARGAKDFVRRVVAGMDIDAAKHQAGSIFLKELPNSPVWQTIETDAPNINLDSYDVQAGRVLIQIRADRQGYLRLAHPVYPAVTVWHNGALAPVAIDSLHFSVVMMDKGNNTYELVAAPSLLRISCFWITAMGLIMLCAGCAVASLWRR